MIDMPAIRLISVKNAVSVRGKTLRHNVSLLIEVDDVAYDKHVDVLWQDKHAAWQTTSANFLCKRGESRELWQAVLSRKAGSVNALPEKFYFSLRVRAQGNESWDNNNGWNYLSEADSGVKLAGGIRMCHMAMPERLTDSQKTATIAVAVDASINAKKVTVVWTPDNWKQSFRTPCFLKADYWQRTAGSFAGNPSNHHVEMWSCRLSFGNAFTVQYAIECEGKSGTLWDNNRGLNYVLVRKGLSVMILNLHCYQEDNQDFKLSQIAQAITEREADIVCLQEVAENWNGGAGDWSSNAARIINERLPKPYYLYADWSHLGFGQYREGVAILSRYPILHQESRYVSESHDVYSIHSRKVVMAQFALPYLGLINVFSAHLSWWEDGFSQQFERLSEWSESLHSDKVKATLLCGDFNVKAGTDGYRLVVDGHRYDDQFLAVSSPAVFEKIFKVVDPHWQNDLANDYRIDYIFMRKESALQAVFGSVLFTDQDYGQVSDHCGFLVGFSVKMN